MKVLLSIKPEYANRILDGTKRYEFRRRVHCNSRVHTVVIYATKPIGKVIGEFSIKHVHSKSPRQLWKIAKDYSGISKRLFFEYFQGRDVGHAIEVNHVKRYHKPMSIKDFLPSGFPPQSYAYISEYAQG